MSLKIKLKDLLVLDSTVQKKTQFYDKQIIKKKEKKLNRKKKGRSGEAPKSSVHNSRFRIFI